MEIKEKVLTYRLISIIHPLIITRKNNENVVVISLDDYNSLMETDYLLSSEKNAKRLLSSLEQARSGKGFEKKLIEIEEAALLTINPCQAGNP